MAEPAAIAQAVSEADALRSQLAALNDKLDQLVEDYNAAGEQLKQTKATATATQSALQVARKDLSQAQLKLGDRLVQIYKRGRVSVLDVLLGAGSFSDLATRVGILQRVGGQDAQLVGQVASHRDEVLGQKAALADLLKEQAAYAAKMEESKQAVEAQLAENQRLLAGKEQQIAELEAEEQARQAELAVQAKAAAEKAAKKAAAEKAVVLAAQAKAQAVEPTATTRPSSSTTTTTHREPTSPTTTTTQPTTTTPTTAQDKTDAEPPATTDTEPVPSSGDGARAVELAMQYLGVPYLWAGADPSGFDCSGLGMYVYAKLGVDLPHSSRMQYDCGAHVSRSQLEPGDLVFFGSPIHHVGMYVGDGNMINAPYTGVAVRIESMDRSDYTGATRVI